MALQRARLILSDEDACTGRIVCADGTESEAFKTKLDALHEMLSLLAIEKITDVEFVQLCFELENADELKNDPPAEMLKEHSDAGPQQIICKGTDSLN
jgi:hypothetical protein